MLEAELKEILAGRVSPGVEVGSGLPKCWHPTSNHISGDKKNNEYLRCINYKIT
jgi:hypothetical protein